MKFKATKKVILWSIFYAAVVSSIMISALGTNEKLRVSAPKTFNRSLIASVALLIAAMIASIILYLSKNKAKPIIEDTKLETALVTKAEQKSIPVMESEDEKEELIPAPKIEDESHEPAPVNKIEDESHEAVSEGYKIPRFIYDNIIQNSDNAGHHSSEILNHWGNNRFLTLRPKYEFFRKFILGSRISTDIENDFVKTLTKQEKVAFLDKVGEHLELKAVAGKSIPESTLSFAAHIFVNHRIKILTAQERVVFLNKVSKQIKLKAAPGKFILEPRVIGLSDNFCGPRGEYFLDSLNASVLLAPGDPTGVFQDNKVFIRQLRANFFHSLQSNNPSKLAKNFITKLAQGAILLQDRETLKITRLTSMQKQIIAENVALLFGGLQNDGENISIEFVEECINLLDSITPTPHEMIIEASLCETIKKMKIRSIEIEKRNAAIERQMADEHLKRGGIQHKLKLELDDFCKNYYALSKINAVEIKKRKVDIKRRKADIEKQINNEDLKQDRFQHQLKLELDRTSMNHYKILRNVYLELIILTGFESSEMIIKYLRQLSSAGNIVIEVPDNAPDGSAAQPASQKEESEFFDNCFELLRQYDRRSGEIGKKAKLEEGNFYDNDFDLLNKDKLKEQLILERIRKEELVNLLFLSRRIEYFQSPSSTDTQLDDVIKKFNDNTIGFALANKGAFDTPLPKSPRLLKRLIESIVLRDDTLDDKAKLDLIEQTYVKLGFLSESVIVRNGLPDTTMMVLGSRVGSAIGTRAQDL